MSIRSRSALPRPAAWLVAWTLLAFSVGPWVQPAWTQQPPGPIEITIEDPTRRPGFTSEELTVYGIGLGASAAAARASLHRNAVPFEEVGQAGASHYEVGRGEPGARTRLATIFVEGDRVTMVRVFAAAVTGETQTLLAGCADLAIRRRLLGPEEHAVTSRRDIEATLIADAFEYPTRGLRLGYHRYQFADRVEFCFLELFHPERP